MIGAKESKGIRAILGYVSMSSETSIKFV